MRLQPRLSAGLPLTHPIGQLGPQKRSVGGLAAFVIYSDPSRHKNGGNRGWQGTLDALGIAKAGAATSPV